MAHKRKGGHANPGQHVIHAPGYFKRKVAKMKRQEEAWAKKSGPVTVRKIDA